MHKYQPRRGLRLPVLLYHHIGPRRPGTFTSLTVSPENLRRHVRTMARWGYAGIRPSDWLAWVEEGKQLPDRPVLLTFDDAYADLAEHGLPVLREYGFGAAVYVVTSQLGGTNRWDQAKGSVAHRVLTAEQIRYWATQGIEFGAHGRTHSSLTTLEHEAAEDEILGSKADMECVLGSKVFSFAYPYGSYNEAIQKIVRDAGLISFTVEEGLNDHSTNLQTLRRTMVQPRDNLLDLRLRLSFGLNRVEHLRRELATWKRKLLSAFQASPDSFRR